ncbi:hypothetical protein [Frigoriglobus tundricola]|uniref:Uncharacterized protein n=1 Tax=Frigoriglobus tundricola TaxID=2774151 RepID=A0A6M5YUB6_9BACT|nr:hypothetical protein [Frigoriglobus tundricola]QJW96502.1 hypothetical protein FTUN_4059 [Frigoriglobus tundricola]
MLVRAFVDRPRIVLFGLAVIGALSVHPTWAQSVGADVWGVPGLHEEMRGTRDERDRLDAEDEEVRRRITVKDAIADELLANRITLAEAVERFTEMFPTRSKYLAAIRDAYPGATDQEKIAHHTVAYTTLHAAPAERAATAERLHAELVRTPSSVDAR